MVVVFSLQVKGLGRASTIVNAEELGAIHIVDAELKGSAGMSNIRKQK